MTLLLLPIFTCHAATHGVIGPQNQPPQQDNARSNYFDPFSTPGFGPDLLKDIENPIPPEPPQETTAQNSPNDPTPGPFQEMPEQQDPQAPPQVRMQKPSLEPKAPLMAPQRESSFLDQHPILKEGIRQLALTRLNSERMNAVNAALENGLVPIMNFSKNTIFNWFYVLEELIRFLPTSSNKDLYIWIDSNSFNTNIEDRYQKKYFRALIKKISKMGAKIEYWGETIMTEDIPELPEKRPPTLQIKQIPLTNIISTLNQINDLQVFDQDLRIKIKNQAYAAVYAANPAFEYSYNQNIQAAWKKGWLPIFHLSPENIKAWNALLNKFDLSEKNLIPKLHIWVADSNLDSLPPEDLAQFFKLRNSLVGKGATIKATEVTYNKQEWRPVF